MLRTSRQTVLCQIVLVHLQRCVSLMRCHALAVCKGSVLTRRPSSAGVSSHAAHCFAASDEEDTQAVQRRASESTLGKHEAVCGLCHPVHDIFRIVLLPMATC